MKLDQPVKSLNGVTPAKAGVQNRLIKPDSRFRGNDVKALAKTFYEFIKLDHKKHRGLSKNLRILILGNLAPFRVGGAEVQARRLAEYFANRGHQVIVMGHAIPTAVLNKKMTGIHLPTVPFNRLFRALSFAFSLGIGLVRKRHDVDVILASVLGESALVAACFKRARILKQPLIVRTAGAGSTGDAAGLQRLPLTFLLIRLINQTCDAILILSPKIAKELAGLRINPDLFIPTACGVPLGKMQSLKKKEQEPLRFVFVGRLRYEKGIGYLLRALRHLAEKGHDLHLDLVGDGPQMAALKALARSLSLETRVFFHGQLPPDRVNLFFRGDTVFVLPSLNEGQPNALLEAMAAGCPAIVTRSGGAEYLVDDTTGLVCPAADSRALAMAMETMIALGAGKRRAMGQAAKARIQEKHAMQLIGDRYLSLFKRLLTAESVERANP